VISGAGTIQTITLTATDASGNISTCTFDVTLQDNTAPTITCPADQTETPNASCQFVLSDYTSLATTTDNCSAVTVTQSPASGSTITGTSTVTLTATDASGNTSTCTFQVILSDGTIPVISCPANQNESADATCQFTLPDYTSMATSSDNCGTPVITQSPAAGTSVNAGTTTITLTATDLAGNTATCTFDVIVTDTIAPVLVCPSDITTCDPLVIYTAPTGTDNCSGVVTTQTDATGLSSGSVFPVGTTTIEYTATDAAGNTTICSFNVIVEAAPDAASAGSDLALCDSVTSVTLGANTPVVGTGTWTILSGAGSLSNPNDPSAVLSNLTIGTTTLSWTITSGACTATGDTITVSMAGCVEIIIPTGFTPDGDGVNDTWEIPFLDLYYPNCHVEVYNRWGAKLFESDGYDNPWNGTYNGEKMPIGSYYFVVDFNDGVTEVAKGTVTIIE
jgi:gliding motility-associated-like protein